MIDLTPVFAEFFSAVAKGEIEIYNEFCLQHELGFFLRQRIPKPGKVEFERSVEHFSFGKGDFVKKEIDIVVSSADGGMRQAIELKCPRNGQYPEQMFKACKDIRFLEQLHAHGFGRGCFIIFVADRLFYEGGRTDGIYSFFRGQVPIRGRITKPTGAAKDEHVKIDGQYRIQWLPAGGKARYAVVGVP